MRLMLHYDASINGEVRYFNKEVSTPEEAFIIYHAISDFLLQFTDVTVDWTYSHLAQWDEGDCEWGDWHDDDGNDFNDLITENDDE